MSGLPWFEPEEEDARDLQRVALLEEARASDTELKAVARGLFGALTDGDGGALRVAVVDPTNLEILASSTSAWAELSEEEEAVCVRAVREGGARCASRGGAGLYWRAVVSRGDGRERPVVVLSLRRAPTGRPTP